jgi:hypothetical protein
LVGVSERLKYAGWRSSNENFSNDRILIGSDRSGCHVGESFPGYESFRSVNALSFSTTPRRPPL